MNQIVKLRAGKRMITAKLERVGERIYFSFPFNRTLIADVKVMEGAKWHGFETPPDKRWSIAWTPRNQFQLYYLMGGNPYARYDAPLLEIDDFDRPLYEVQQEFVQFIMTRKQCVIAGEMGVGKTLAVIEAAERMGVCYGHDIWYVGPKAGVRAVRRELSKWDAALCPKMMTYQGMVKEVKNWDDDEPAPKFVIFDESSKLKNMSAQRTQQAKHLANSMRDEYGDEAIIVLMTGTPAPKSPTDWWAQAEIACPGFLKEGSLSRFKQRLCLTEMRDAITGGQYPHLLTWLDDARKCYICGEQELDPIHSEAAPIKMPTDVGRRKARDRVLKGAPKSGIHGWKHPFVQSTNEVALLSERLKGLVIVKFKKDCLDLPDKTREQYRLRPTRELLRAAKLIRKTSTRAVQALIRCRTLADGFQYTEVEDGMKQCELCCGTGKVAHMVRAKDDDEDTEQPFLGVDPSKPPADITQDCYERATINCPRCNGTLEEPILKRTIAEVAHTPKDDFLKEQLQAFDDVGRYVVWCGFTGTIERLIPRIKSVGWDILRYDKQVAAYAALEGDILDPEKLLSAMDLSHPHYESLKREHPKVCFLGNAEAGGMALTLTGSPCAYYYSNGFGGEGRSQSEDRIHRAGMDTNRACLIRDAFVLPEDEVVFNNLMAKRSLEKMSMGDLFEQVDALGEHYEPGE
jgi:hypothetical protein